MGVFVQIPTTIGKALRNANRNPRWSKFIPLFKRAVRKETWSDHRGFWFVFRDHFEFHLLGNGLYQPEVFEPSGPRLKPPWY